jgi:hypothetical protein
VKKLALLLLLAIPLFAQPVSLIRFDPPDPTPRTAVYAHVHIPTFGCGVTGTTVTRSGSIISISLQPSVVLCFAARPADITVDLGVVPAGVYDVVVTPGMLLSAIAEAELDVRDANPPFDVRPNTRGSDGDVVRLYGANLRGAVSVHFGSTNAEVLSVLDDRIEVREPMLAPGTYDVTVEKPGQTLVATAAFHVPDLPKYSHAYYERVLFPVFWSGGGAFGAQWRTDATLFNGSLLTITPLDSSIFLIPQPKQTIVATASSTTPNGVLEVLPRQATATINFGLNVRDLSRDAQDLGTEIPVIRESQLFAAPFSIPNIPNDPRYRITLRLYDIDGSTFFGVRFISAGGLELMPQAFINLSADAALRNGGVATINDLIAAYPQLAGKGPLRLEIDPFIASGARAAWGFVSVTNNETQRVTVISPQ